MLVLWTTSFFCAGQLSPSGGPPDTTPPHIIESSPEPNAVKFSDQKIAFKFNKYVDRTSFEQSLYISPPPGRLTFDWGGKEVEIHFSELLRTSSTYVVTIGTDFHDTRNNKLRFAYALAFSTGDHVDSAYASGTVYDPQPDGIMVCAYRLEGRTRDTLNPTHTPPDYLTQTGTGGKFTLPNMAPGTYRIIAVRDQYKNLLYDVQTDEYGVAAADISIDPARTAVTGVAFVMTKEDTVHPRLSSARAFDRRHLLLRFSEAMGQLDLSVDSVIIADTTEGTRLSCLAFSWDAASPTTAYVTTSAQESTIVYRVSVNGLSDLAGNQLNQQGNYTIVGGSSRADTMKPSIDLVGVSDSAQDFSWDDSLKFSITKAIHRLPFQHGFSLLDEHGNHPGGLFRWIGSSSVDFIPSLPLAFGHWYVVKILLDSLKDDVGRAYHDTSWTRHFRVIEEKFLGSIHGKVIDGPGRKRGRIHLMSREISRTSVRPREIVLDSAGSFTFVHLPEGKYVLSAFSDDDSSGGYSYGKVFPYRPSEPFVPAGDTLKVRARWPLDGVLVKFQ